MERELMSEKKLLWQDWALLISLATFKTTIIGFYMIALVTMLKDQGFTLNQLSWIYMLAMIEAAAFLISPLIERFSFKSFGQFKSWLFISNLAMLFGFIGFYFIDPQRDILFLLFICAVFCLMSLIFSCAVLGLTCRLLPFKKRGYGGAIQVAGARLGRMVGGGLALYCYQHFGWNAAISLMVELSSLLSLQLLCYREAETPVAKADAMGLPMLFKRLFTFWQRPNSGFSWFCLLFLSCIPCALVATTFIPRLSEMGWQPQNIGLLLAIIVPLVCIVVVPLSGYLLQKYSRFQMVNWILLIQIALVFSFVYSDNLVEWQSEWIALPIILLSLAYSFMLPIVLTLLMDKAEPHFVTLDTALQYSAVLLGVYPANFFALRIANLWGYNSVYIIATGFAIAVWLLAYVTRQRNF
ncbi:MFS transporter [Pasteurella testudinis]|uniref:MFS transporter n=1 Tax=Pasteurella testudinis TaxID=761 RepID=UPI0040598B05